MQTLQEQIVETKATVKQTVETGKQEINQSRANLRRKLETGRQEINQARATLNQKIETGREQINQAEAILKQKAETGEEQINQAKANLTKLPKYVPKTCKPPKPAIESAIATKQKAQVDLNLSYVKAPVSGYILKVHSRQGEGVNTQDGIVELGRTRSNVRRSRSLRNRHRQSAKRPARYSQQPGICRHFGRNSRSHRQTNRQKNM